MEVCKNASSSAELLRLANVLDDMVFRSNHPDEVVGWVRDVIRPLLLHRDVHQPVLLFHVYGWLYGGAERLISKVSGYLANCNFRIVLAVFEPIHNTGYSLDSRIAFIPIRGEDDRIGRLLRFAELLRPDLFVGHNNSIPELVSVYPHLRQIGIRSIAYSLEYYFFPHQNVELVTSVIARNECLAQADVACFLTGFSSNVYNMNYPNAATMAAPNTFAVTPDDTMKLPGKTVLALGRFNDPIKRIDRILIAFHHLLQSHSDARLLIVGPYNLSSRIPVTSEETVANLLDSLCIPDDRIHFAGEQGRVEDYYAQADVFILASENEGFPMVLNEAGCHGLPSVVVDIPGLEDIITDGENGYIVSHQDMRTMAARIAGLFDDLSLWRTMSRNSKALASRYSIEIIGERWLRLIDAVLTAPSRLELNRLLAARFMNPLDNPQKFTMLAIQEYERAAMSISRLTQHRSGIVVGDSATSWIKKIKRHVRAYGIRATAEKIRRKLAFRVLERYGAWRRRLRGGYHD